MLAEGEVIRLTRSSEPGVELLEVQPRTGIRHFRVGPGEDVIHARDQAGNRRNATCGLRRRNQAP